MSNQFELWIMHSGDQEFGPINSVSELRSVFKQFQLLNIDVVIQYKNFSKTFTLEEANDFISFLLE